MKLLFKERLFTWFDSYDVYNEMGDSVYHVEGKMSWGHRLQIYDQTEEMIGEIREEVFTFLPCFRMYYKGLEIGLIKKEFTFFHSKFHLTCNDWEIRGDVFDWDYDVYAKDRLIMHVKKELFHFTDTYVLDIVNKEDQLMCLMIVLAIDAAKCSESN